MGEEHLVLDLSCRKKDGKYYIVTDRWQRFTEQMITEDLLEQLAGYCDEFLIHAVDVEGKAVSYTHLDVYKRQISFMRWQIMPEL